MDRIKAIIIDDESLARDLVRAYLQDFKQVEVVAEASNGFLGLKAINDNKPDLVFLDVQMPKLTGFEMLELMESAPDIIFTTAYNEYAIKAFEHNAVDYLLKPFSIERFHEAVVKAIKRISNKGESGDMVDLLIQHREREKEILSRVVVKHGSEIHVIGVDHIRYLEAQDDYVMIYTQDGHFLKQKTMKYFQEHLNSKEFCRIHRSFLVRVEEILRLEPYQRDGWIVVTRKQEKLRVSRNGYKMLKEILDF